MRVGESIGHVRRLCHRTFIVSEQNAYRPHALHPERAAGYSAFFILTKLLLLAVIVILPSNIFATPEAINAQARAIVDATNAYRQTVGVAPLVVDDRLLVSSNDKAYDMVEQQYFSHVNPDGRGPAYFFAHASYPFIVAGENLAMGLSDPRALVAAWAASPTHRANLIDEAFRDIGVGVIAATYRGTPTVFVAQHIGRPRDAASGAFVAPRPSSTVRVRAASVAWEARDSETALTALATLDGDVARAVVEVQGQEIALERTPGTTQFVGHAMLSASANELFRVTVPPVLVTSDEQGETVTQSIVWEDPKVIRPTLRDRYVQARAYLPETLGPLFRVTAVLYAVALGFFTVAWVTNLVSGIRRKSYAYVLPGGAVLLLLLLLLAM